MTIFNPRTTTPALTLWLLVLATYPLFAFAHEGENHGEEFRALPAAHVASGSRLELRSPDVELLVVVHDGKLTLYADHYATNEPIRNARIELESNGRKIQSQAANDGSYIASADWLKQPGKHALQVSIESGDLADLLIGTLEVPSATPRTHARTWRDYAKWVAGGGAAIIVFAVLFRLISRRKHIAAVALPLLAASLLGMHSTPSFAHGDEDHSDKPKTAPAATAVSGMPAATQATSVRLPDGSIFAPKPVQRLLGIRTVLGETRDLARTIELNGRIAADPNFNGRVQSSQPGRIAAPAGGFPTIGMKVHKGQILAYIEPAASNIEKGNQQAQLAELNSRLSLAEKRAQRLEQLVGSLPQKEIDAAQAEAASLKARKAAVAASLYQQEALRAPVSGVISQASVITGKIAEAREVLFELIEPSKLWVEAIAYDSALAGQVARATAITADNQPLTLAFIGQSYQLREQALPMQFAIKPPSPAEAERHSLVKDHMPPLSVGQPVKVFVQTRQTIRSIPVPAGSVIKNSSGENVVWVHTSAERFVAQRVKVQPVDANTLAVLEGLHDGDRVVTQGASLLSQIR